VKKLFLILSLSSIFLLGTAQKIPIDKQYHFYAGATIGAWGTMTVQPKGMNQALAGLGWATLAGLGKEVFDLGVYGKFDCKDLGFTVAGAVVSTGIITGVKSIIKHGQKHKKYKRQLP
jgi:hypothetical protein